MIKQADAASPAMNRPVFEIKDSLLGDALERNELSIPPRVVHATLGKPTLANPADAEQQQTPS